MWSSAGADVRHVGTDASEDASRRHEALAGGWGTALREVPVSGTPQDTKEVPGDRRDGGTSFTTVTFPAPMLTFPSSPHVTKTPRTYGCRLQGRTPAAQGPSTTVG